MLPNLAGIVAAAGYFPNPAGIFVGAVAGFSIIVGMAAAGVGLPVVFGG